MNSETRTCQNCRAQFVVDAQDFDFYKKIDVPPPTWCPECRLVRRMLVRNERALFKRPCDLCKEEKILMFDTSTPFTAYCFQCWWSDKWDPMSYGRTYDPSKPFLAQFAELFRAVPRLGIIQQGNMVNSTYTNRVSDLRDCYMIFASANNENCSYGVSYWDTKDAMDCYNVQKSERCYECIDSYNCNNLRYSQECISCADSAFLINCRGCTNCFGCVNLRNKSYCMFNVQYSKSEYEEKYKALNIENITSILAAREHARKLTENVVVPYAVTYHAVDVSGNWIEESKNTRVSFNCREVEDGKYLFGIVQGKDLMDLMYWSKGSELIYESSNIGRQCANVYFSNECWDQLMRGQYCMNCHSSSDLFGCVGLRKKQYCILNMQYSKEEYDALVSRIKDEMQSLPYRDAKGRTFCYGEYFPPEILPFAYNETIAQEYFPKTKKEVEKQGYVWKEAETKNHHITLQPEDLPQTIKEVQDGVLSETIGCTHRGACNEQCTVAFRIIPQELDLYRNMGLPLPRLCPNCRHYARLAQRNPTRLWHRKCSCSGVQNDRGTLKNTKTHSHGATPCPKEFETSYAPDRPEIVYCEDCYQQEIS